MLFRSSTLVAIGASAVIASPLQRRQDTTAISASPAVSDASASTSTVLAAATGSEAATTAVSSVTSAIASVVSSAASISSTAVAPTATTSGNATSPQAYAFGCPDGYSLTYGVGVAPYPGVSIDQAYPVLQNWGSAIPPPIVSVSSEGQGEGATRMWTLSAGATNLSVSEVLTRVNATSPTFLQQEWNLTSPINVSSSLIVSNYTSVFSLYSNSSTNDTSAQLFINACVSDQPAGLTLLSELITAYLSGLPSLLGNSTMSMNSTTGVAGSATSAASSSATGVLGSASSGVAGVTNSVASGVTGAVGSVTSGAGGAVGTLTSGAGGVINTITSGGGSVLSAGISAVTGIIPSFAA